MLGFIGVEHMLRSKWLWRSVLRIRHTHMGHGSVVVDRSRGWMSHLRPARSRREVRLAQSAHSSCSHARVGYSGHEAHRHGHLQGRLNISLSFIILLYIYIYIYTDLIQFIASTPLTIIIILLYN